MFRRTKMGRLLLAALVIIGILIALNLSAFHKSSQKKTVRTVTGISQLTLHSAFFQAKAYHVSGDGKTDSTGQIRTAVAAAAAVGGTVYFDKGTYLISSPIDVPSGVSILGAGKDQTVFKATNEYSDHLFSLGGNQTIENAGFVSQLGVQPAGDGITFSDCRFQSSIQGIQNSVTVRNLTVINCLFEKSGYGILSNLQPSYDVRIISCRFLNNFGDAIEINAPSDGWVIENCTFRGITSKTQNAGFGVGAAISAKNIVIKGSTFEKINGQGIHVEDHAQVVVVNCVFRNNGAKDYPGSPQSDIAVLSQADLTVAHSVFLASDANFSKLAIYNTDLPVGGTVTVTSSKFDQKSIGAPVTSKQNTFLK
jgi:Endopolygalacturonase